MNFLIKEKRQIRCLWGGIVEGFIVKNSSNNEPTKKIVVLHGWLDNLNSMMPLVEKLVEQKHNYEFFLYDNPGHGHSTHFPPGFDYNSVSLIRTLREVINNLGWRNENYALLGHSYGALIVTGYGACFPDEISCIVAIDALPRVEVSTEQFWEVHGHRIDEQIEFYSKKAKKYENDLTMEKAIELKKMTRPGISDADSRLLAERSIRLNSDKKLEFTRDEALKTRNLTPFDENSVHGLIANIRAPFLFIGALNPRWPRPQQTIDLFQEYNENFEMTLIDGSHHLQLTNVDEVAERIDQFFNTFLYRTARTSNVLLSKL